MFAKQQNVNVPNQESKGDTTAKLLLFPLINFQQIYKKKKNIYISMVADYCLLLVTGTFSSSLVTRHFHVRTERDRPSHFALLQQAPERGSVIEQEADHNDLNDARKD